MKVAGREVSQSLNNTEHCVSEAHGHGPCMVTDKHTYTHTQIHTQTHTHTHTNRDILTTISVSVPIVTR